MARLTVEFQLTGMYVVREFNGFLRLVFFLVIRLSKTCAKEYQESNREKGPNQQAITPHMQSSLHREDANPASGRHH